MPKAVPKAASATQRSNKVTDIKAGTRTSFRTGLRIEPADIQRVLDTAARLFAAHGFDSVGIRDIARESGVKMPSIYYHFTSKESLHDEAIGHQYELAMDRVGKAINAQRLPAERIESFVSEVFDMFFADRTFFLLVQRDVADSAASRIPLRFMRSYDIVISESQRMLSVALGREVETRDAFAVISLILGFCELTVVAAKSGAVIEREEWNREQKRYLTTVVNRVLTR